MQIELTHRIASSILDPVHQIDVAVATVLVLAVPEVIAKRNPGRVGPGQEYSVPIMDQMRSASGHIAP